MKKIIKYIFGLLNINVTKIPGRSKAIADIEEKEINIAKQKFQWLSKYSINKIVDIGANEGQFASGIYKVFPTAGFFCFEPIPGVFNLLKENLEKYNNFCFFQLALGDAKGKNIIHLNDFSPSSSILEMDKLHETVFAFTKNSRPVEIEVETLDSFIDVIKPDNCTLVKIDVQGFELKVLEGGISFLKKSKIIIIEMSFEILYKTQPLFHEVYTFLYNLGFEYHGNTEQLFNPFNQEILQADCLFVNKN